MLVGKFSVGCGENEVLQKAKEKEKSVETSKEDKASIRRQITIMNTLAEQLRTMWKQESFRNNSKKEADLLD